MDVFFLQEKRCLILHGCPESAELLFVFQSYREVNCLQSQPPASVISLKLHLVEESLTSDLPVDRQVTQKLNWISKEYPQTNNK